MLATVDRRVEFDLIAVEDLRVFKRDERSVDRGDGDFAARQTNHRQQVRKRSWFGQGNVQP